MSALAHRINLWTYRHAPSGGALLYMYNGRALVQHDAADLTRRSRAWVAMGQGLSHLSRADGELYRVSAEGNQRRKRDEWDTLARWEERKGLEGPDTVPRSSRLACGKRRLARGGQ
jgi:hypothetical protein